MLETIIITSLVITGVNIASQPGFLLHGVKRLLETYFYKEDGELSSMRNPIRGCATCMASVRSVMVYVLLNGFSLIMFIHLLLIIPAVATLNNLLEQWLDG